MPNIASALPVPADAGAALRTTSKTAGTDNLFASLLDGVQMEQQSAQPAAPQPASAANDTTPNTTVDQALLAQMNTVLTKDGGAKAKDQPPSGDTQSTPRSKKAASPGVPSAIVWQDILQTLNAASATASDGAQSAVTTAQAGANAQPFTLAQTSQPLASSLRSTTSVSALSTARLAMPAFASASVTPQVGSDTPSPPVATQDDPASASVTSDATASYAPAASSPAQPQSASAATQPQTTIAPQNAAALQSALASLGTDQTTDLTASDIAAALSAQPGKQAAPASDATPSNAQAKTKGTSQADPTVVRQTKTTTTTTTATISTSARTPQAVAPATAQTSKAAPQFSAATVKVSAAPDIEMDQPVAANDAAPAPTPALTAQPATSAIQIATASAASPDDPVQADRVPIPASKTDDNTAVVTRTPTTPASRMSLAQPVVEDESASMPQKNAPATVAAQTGQPNTPAVQRAYAPSPLFSAQQLATETGEPAVSSTQPATTSPAPSVSANRAVASAPQNVQARPATIDQPSAKIPQPAPSTPDGADVASDPGSTLAKQPAAQTIAQQAAPQSDDATDDTPASAATQPSVQTAPTTQSQQPSTPSVVQTAIQVQQPVVPVTAPTVMPKTQPQAVKPVTTQAAKNTTTADSSDPAQTLSDAVADANHQAVPASATVAKAQPQQSAASDSTPAKDGSQPVAQHDAATQNDTRSATNTQTAADNTPADTAPQAVVAQTNTGQPAHLQTDAPANAAANAVTAATPAQSAQTTTQAVPLQTAAQPDAAAQPNVAALALTIAVKTKAGQKQFDIRLDPPELGRVDVKLSIDDAGKVQANLSAEKPHTLELLQRDKGTLERSLRDAGLDLTGGGLNFSLKGQNQQSGDSGAQSRGRAFSAASSVQTDLSTPIAGNKFSPADGRLDIRV